MRSGLCSAEWSKLPTGGTFSSVFSLSLFFFFSWDICFLFPLTWMATISYISQLLCLFVGWRDNGAVFLNAQVVSLSFSFLTFPSSSSPPRPFSHLTFPPRVSPVFPTLSRCLSHLLSPLFYLSSSFLPLYLAISLTSWPFLSHLSLLHWFADSWETEHKSILFITPHCTLHNPNRLFPLTQCKGAHTRTHKSAWFYIEELAHTCTRQTSKQSAAREQCVDSQLILIPWLCTIQYFFYYMKTN